LSALIDVQDANFEEKVLRATRPVLADFSAAWCGPCKQLKPTVEELAGEYEGRVDMVHIDVDEAQQTAATYGVMGVPTLMFFKDGEVADKVTGVIPKETLKQKLDRLLS
jgi:thioredoxin 1